jgi:hypothetical protein
VLNSYTHRQVKERKWAGLVNCGAGSRTELLDALTADGLTIRSTLFPEGGPSKLRWGGAFRQTFPIWEIGPAVCSLSP